MEAPPDGEFQASLKNYFDSKTLSDAVIRCGDRDFAVHSLILYCHSEYFKKQLDGPWKESSDRVIDIMDFDPAIVEAMTRFLYSFDYEAPANTSDMIFHAKVYQIADKYGIQGLKRFSATKYHTSIDKGWEAEDFPTAIALAYTTTPTKDRGLRDITVQVAINNIGILMSQEAFCETLSDNPELAADIILFMNRRYERVKEYKCQNCRRVFLMGFAEFQEPYQLHSCPSCSDFRTYWKPVAGSQ